MATQFINGSWLSGSGEQLNKNNPATGILIWQGQAADAQQVDAAVRAARAAFKGWARTALDERLAVIRRFGELLNSNKAALAEIIAKETGKPMWEAQTEVTTMVNKVEISIKAYNERTGERAATMGDAQAVLRHKPHGVVAVFGPYNFPGHLPNGHIVPALIAGNTVIFKPSELTPWTAQETVRLWHEAGLPAGVINLTQGAKETGIALANHDGIDGLFFTGSSGTGNLLHKAFGGQPEKILALEMGGNNPLVVWDTPEIGAAAALVIQSAFLSSGQRCTAASRLIVRDAMADALITEVKKLADRLIVDHPHADPQPYMGPVIDNPTADGLTESFLYLMSHGGRPIKHMVRPQKGLPFLTPAIIDVTAMKERPDVELFGPLLQIVRVPDFETAIAEANSSRYGLSASLVGGSPEQYAQFWGNVRAGVINWNRPTNGASGTAPFGGVGVSGNHRPSAYYAADYCAYPVASAEIEQPRATIGIGLKDIDVSAMGD